MRARGLAAPRSPGHPEGHRGGVAASTHLSACPGSAQTGSLQERLGRSLQSRPRSRSAGVGISAGAAGPSPAAPQPLPAGLTASCVPVLLATMLQMGPPPPSTPRAALSPDRSYSVMSPLSPAPNSRSPAAQHSDSTVRNSCPGITCAGTGSHHGTDRYHPVRTSRAKESPVSAPYDPARLGTGPVQARCRWKDQVSTVRARCVPGTSSTKPSTAQYSPVQPLTFSWK